MKKKRYAIFLFYSILFSGNLFSEGLPPFGLKEEKAKELFKTGLVYFHNRNYTAAKENFLKSLSIKEDFNLSRKFLSDSYFLNGEWNESLNELEILEGKNTKSPYIKNRADVMRQILGGSTGKGKRTFYKSISGDSFRGFRFRNPTDALVDEDGNLYVLSFETQNIIKFNPDGVPIGNFKGGIGRSFEGPLYFTIFKKKLFVSDFVSDRINILSDAGDFLFRFGSTGKTPGKFHGPAGISISPKGEVYVCDSGNSRIQKFSLEGNFLQEFGLAGKSKLSNPVGILYKDQDHIYVVDKASKKIIIFDDEGNFVSEISHKNMKKPRSVKVHNNRLYIADELNGLMIYSPDSGKWSKVSSFMDETGKYRKLDRPFSSAYDYTGSLYAVDYARHRIDIFSPKNLLLSNLNIFIEKIETSRFPDVSVFLTVKNKSGLDITKIHKNSFRIFENDNQVPLPGLTNLNKFNDNLSVSLVFENSKKLSEHSDRLESFLGPMLRKFSKNDKLEVIRSGQDSTKVYEFGYSMHDIFARIRKSAPENEINLGKGMYFGLSDLIPELGPRCLILLVSGESLPNAFNQFGIRKNVQFAKAHSIPIFVLSLGADNQMSSIYKEIADSTGGLYLKVPGSAEERNLYEIIKTHIDKRYILSFKSVINPDLTGKYIDLRVDVNYRNTIGKSEGGYFVP
ncbi:MAG: 6-bladed beta-propeller [Leptospiraceae bacterium]|nr:6-bladed beta-propeller [Leptospiraceae bacterium]MCK6379893.1 6-bladed beta-propeller [Leptospiraceae bacterium]NUM40226.1 6-bladed beta-propeller [Leptospiraceae bacterium]